MRIRKEVVYIVVGIILSLLSYIFDSKIIAFVVSLRNFYLDYFFISITFLGAAIIVFFILTSLFLWNEHKRRWILPLWATLAISVVLIQILKHLIGRPRPFETGIVTVLGIAFYFDTLFGKSSQFSFPSSHSTIVFSALPVLDKEFPKFKYAWFVFACLVALSRVYFGMHYMSDVVSGAVIGYLSGILVLNIEEKYELSLKLMRKLKIRK